MRIAQVCHNYYDPRLFIGGVGIHVKEISERLAREHSVSVLTTDPYGILPREEVIDGVMVRRFKSFAPGNTYYYSPELLKYIYKNSNEYGIIHAHNYHAFPAFCASLAPNNNLIFTPHYFGSKSQFLRRLVTFSYRLIGREIFKKAKAIICTSRYEADLVVRAFDFVSEKITIIPNGVAIPKSPIRTSDEFHRSMLYVGRLMKGKGVEHIIRAMPYVDNNVKLEIVGIGPDKGRLVELVNIIGVGDRVSFYENLSRVDIMKKYIEADLFICLSKQEIFGISVAEALASGTPCIVTDTSELTNWIDDKYCFGVRHPVNIDELVTVINRILKEDPTLRANSYTKNRILDWDEVVNLLCKVYFEMTNH